MNIRQLKTELVTLQEKAAEIRALGDCLQDCWIGYSASGGTATGLGKQPGRYATVRSRHTTFSNGKKTEYISVANTVLLAAREGEIARGKELTKIEREISRVSAKLDKATALIKQLGGKVAPKNVLLSSDSNEWYTPLRFIELARATMGGIDIDPASNETAQFWIKAKTWYGKLDDGFNRDWHGRLWLNPPYGIREKGNYGAGAWIEKAIAQYESGNVSQAVLLVRGDSKGVKALIKRFPCCEPFNRIRFVREDGTASDKPVPGCRFFYLGASIDNFRQQFAVVGAIYGASDRG